MNEQDNVTETILQDYLTGVEIDVNGKPEELVRQAYLRELHEVYGYPKSHMAKEVAITSGVSEVLDVVTHRPKRADIVIYKSDKQLYDEMYVVVECKQEDVTDGERQAKSYGNATTASIVIWHNGGVTSPTKYWERTQPVRYGYKPRLTLPRYGEYYGDNQIEKKNLRPATDLRSRFRRIHNNIYANIKSSDKTKVFNQMLYLLFIKMYDERLYDPICSFYLSGTEEDAILKTGKSASFRKRIWDLFTTVKSSPDFRDVFSGKEELELDLEQVAYIVSEIELLSILFTDVKGEAFQAFINDYFRGDAGQFFTPDPVKWMIVEMLAPKPDTDIVFDPACGSGGFLVATLNHYRQLIKQKEGMVDAAGNPRLDGDLSNADKKMLSAEIKRIAANRIVGVDFDDALTKIAKMYMVMVDDGHSGIFTANSLLPQKRLTELAPRVTPEFSDIIMTNPPFGSKGKVSRKEILENFDLGYKWKKSSAGRYEMLPRIERNLQGGKTKGDGQIPDVLFLERCYNLLKFGGRMAIVLPDGDLSNQSFEYVRQWLSDRMRIVAVVSLPPHTFVPFGAGPKSSVLVCIKPPQSSKILKSYPIFFAKLDSIGYDVRGKVLYRRNGDGRVLDRSGKALPQDIDVIAREGQIDTDIPDVLKAWAKFRSVNRLWR